jgi:hypothetical protein
MVLNIESGRETNSGDSQGGTAEPDAFQCAGYREGRVSGTHIFFPFNFAVTEGCLQSACGVFH